jgi:hypothetical protein
MPTLVAAPPLLGERGMPLTLLTVPANLAGLPALALPVPGGPAGLPASLQLIGPQNSEEQLIALARVIEAALALSRHRPELAWKIRATWNSGVRKQRPEFRPAPDFRAKSDGDGRPLTGEC